MCRAQSIEPAVSHPHAAAPALWPAAAVLAGTCVAPHLGFLPMGPVAALLALGLALSSRAGLTVAALALGLANAALRPANEPHVDPRRPVELTASVASHPVRHEDGEVFFHARARSWSQGNEVERGAFDLQVTLPPGSPLRAIGETVRLRGYLRRSPGFANGARRQEPGPWRLRLKSDRLLGVEAPPKGLARLAGRLRRGVEPALARGESPGTALVRALVLGDRTRLPKSWRQGLRRSGLAHLLAVSGLHVGLLALVLLVAGSALPRGLRYLPPLAGVAAYLALVGPQPAVLRASGMGLLALGALMLERPPQGLNALAGCAALLALHDPAIVGRLGFQLSAAATAGILVLAPRWARRWTKLPGVLRQPLAVAVAAQVATLPWILPLAGGFHPAAPLLNLAAVPYLAVSLVLSFLWLAAAQASAGAAAAAQPALDVLTWPLAALAGIPPSPALFMPWDVHPAAVPALAAAAVAAGCWPRAAARCALFAWLLVQVGGGERPSPAAAPAPELVALDVGQGDALVLRDGQRALLVDGGGWPHGDLGGRVLVPALAALGVRRLAAVVLTHPDRDHCGGLVDLARYLPVEEVWMGPGWLDDACAAELLSGPAKRWRVLWRGEVERLGRWRIEVLHPDAGTRRGRNDRSLVLSASVFDHRVLLAGDVEAEAERRLVRRQGTRLRAGVLKVAHHGSKTSSAKSFLDAVRPRLAVVSAGNGNPYGHPHPAVVERLRAAGALVLRIDRSGTIRLRFHAARTSLELPGSPRRMISR